MVVELLTVVDVDQYFLVADFEIVISNFDFEAHQYPNSNFENER